MIFGKQENLEDKIIKILTEKQSVKNIQRKLLDYQENVTVQGIYRILKLLTENEIVIKQGKSYEINKEWTLQMKEFLGTKKEVINLNNQNKVQFELKSLIELDQQWKNVIIPLQENFPEYPVFMFNPHKFWIHLSKSRKESEEKYYKTFLKNKHYLFSIIGGDTNFDKIDRKNIQNEYVRIETGNQIMSEHNYLIIIQDYLIITQIPQKIAHAITVVYQKNTTTTEFENNLKSLGIEKKKIKLVIERNKEKAKKLRKTMAKNFYIPKEIREKFDLF